MHSSVLDQCTKLSLKGLLVEFVGEAQTDSQIIIRYFSIERCVTFISLSRETSDFRS